MTRASLSVIFSLLFFYPTQGISQEWAWLSGDRNSDLRFPMYGNIGEANGLNTPGGRIKSATWVDASGSVYLFGGIGFSQSSGSGRKGDFWKWDGTNWTWLGGSVGIEAPGVYGTKGVGAINNWPGARDEAASWVGTDGSFYLFGGYGTDSNGAIGQLNDLWKWDGTHWIWMGGSNVVNGSASYGTKGVSALTNIPGSRNATAFWRSQNGDFYLFGGFGLDGNGDSGRLNDIWKWDGTHWTWLGGSNIRNEFGVYGTKGVPNSANSPGGRSTTMSWVSGNGDVYIFGGSGRATSGSNTILNDLWKWDGTNWTWLSGTDVVNAVPDYGTQGVPVSSNVPGPRTNAITWAENGNFYLFGGTGRDSQSNFGALNDLWKWDGTNWTWVDGNNTVGNAGIYGTQGVGASGNIPGARHSMSGWMGSDGHFYLFGGNGFDITGLSNNGTLNDIWQWDGTHWTWVKGTEYSIRRINYGDQGVGSSQNQPGGRAGVSIWSTQNGDVFMFGGFGYDNNSSSGWLNDLWKWDGTKWTWVSGSKVNNTAAVYGTKGVPASGNMPGSREGASSWTDLNGDLYLFGGFGWDASGGLGYLNDLWRWDGANWTWTSGSNVVSSGAAYGSKGVASSGNLPGGRYRAATWQDSNGNVLIFGGVGDASTNGGNLNDLWRWDGTNWTWLSGADIANSAGEYGVINSASPNNVPGARQPSANWADDQGNLYLFGGSGLDETGNTGFLNDLWKWDGTHWTWIAGTKQRNNSGTYGLKGEADSDNTPGTRFRSGFWQSKEGVFYLFGGLGYDKNGTYGLLNDFWKWDGAFWTWVGGENLIGGEPELGTQGVYSASNIPRALQGAASWVNANGELGFLGGISTLGSSSYATDLWSIRLPPVFQSETSVTVMEGEAGTVIDVDATDGHGGANDANVTYAISGTDAAQFSIDTNTGLITFQTPSDWSNPVDADTDNIYELTVTADNGTVNSTQNIEVFVYPNSDGDGNDWTLIGQSINGEAAGDLSGRAVSLSNSGNIVAIGAIGNDGNGLSNAGHVRVYSRVANSWVQLGGDIDGVEVSEDFGFSLSLSADGQTLAVGARLNDSNASNSGQVRIYALNGNTWQPLGNTITGAAILNQFGHSVDLDAKGRVVAVGAIFNDEAGTNRGITRVYALKGSNWTVIGSPIGGVANDDRSGYRVRLSDDGKTLATSAINNDNNGSNSGHVRVYRYNGSDWLQLGSAIDGEAAGDNSGFSLDMSADGNTVAIGALFNIVAGHVRVYRYTATGWVQKGADINGESAGDQFGYALDLSDDGKVLAVGAHLNDGNGSDSGHFRVYRYSSNSWVQVGVDIDGVAALDRFGNSISLNATGEVVAVGGFHNDDSGSKAGHVRVFEVNSLPVVSALSITGTLALAEELTAAYTYTDNDGDLESGTTYQWYRADDDVGTNKVAIPGADAVTYTLAGSDLGKFVSVEISPNDGKSFGLATESTALAVKQPQTITFSSLPVKTYGDASFGLTATTDSGLPITYSSSDINVAIVVGSTLNILTAGTVTITASQTGNSTYSPASDVSQALTINKATLTVAALDKLKREGEPNPALEISFIGFVNGDTEASISVPFAVTTAGLNSPVGDYPISLTGGAATNYSLKLVGGTLTILPTTATVSIKVLLEGAYGGAGAMNATLGSLVEQNQPYTSLGHSGNESFVSLPAGAIDWVLVELREANSASVAFKSTKVGSAAGLLMSDGSIKASDGSSALQISLTGNLTADFFLVVYHRNHLPVMSANALSQSSGNYSIDFTTNSSLAFQGADALISLPGMLFGMAAGDTDADGDIDSDDRTTWRSQNGRAFSYQLNSADFNLDGVINAIDLNGYWRKNNLTNKTSKVPTQIQN